MKAHSCAWMVLLCLSGVSLAQVASSQTSAASAASAALQTVPAAQEQATQTDFTSRKGFVLEEETPVRLRLNRTISSADAHVGTMSISRCWMISL
jgi:hypothetical protein